MELARAIKTGFTIPSWLAILSKSHIRGRSDRGRSMNQPQRSRCAAILSDHDICAMPTGLRVRA